MSAANAPIPYSDAPPGSRIILERDEGLLRIIIPPAGTWLYARTALLLAVIIVLPMKATLIYAFYKVGSTLPIGALAPMLMRLLIPAGIGLGLLLLAAFLLGRQQRIIEIDRNELRIIGEIFRWRGQRKWPRETLKGVKYRWFKVAVFDRRGKLVVWLSGNNAAESQWIAKKMAEELGEAM